MVSRVLYQKTKNCQRKVGYKMKKIKIGRLVELIIGMLCIGFLIYEFFTFTLLPLFNGGYLPSLTYFGCGVNLVVIAYLVGLEAKIKG